MIQIYYDAETAWNIKIHDPLGVDGIAHQDGLTLNGVLTLARKYGELHAALTDTEADL